MKIKQEQQAVSTAVGMRSGPTLDLSYWQNCQGLETEGKAVMRQEVSGFDAFVKRNQGLSPGLCKFEMPRVRLWAAGCNMWIQQRTSLGMDTSWESGNVLEVGMLITMDG